VTLLAVKIILSPLCVLAVSLAGRRWGLGVAGVLGGLPVVAGPILLIETVIHGDEFGAEAAGGTLLGLAALTAFVLVYSRLAQTAGPLRSLFCGWTAFLLAVAVLGLFRPPPGLSLVLVPSASRSACGSCPLPSRCLRAPNRPPAGTYPGEPSPRSSSSWP
jgi:hypothetical protein